MDEGIICLICIPPKDVGSQVSDLEKSVSAVYDIHDGVGRFLEGAGVFPAEQVSCSTVLGSAFDLFRLSA